ncbi:dihydroxyacetone kinase phosphoryl donor subunit DhaM [Anaerosalibacter bizertensis]|uniref:phosphoenolpyruvate--glycerone phosphotransferase n=1 Tax=Anaerosalibacter bizertensis TaxID=932217 RepID=A0A9Q4AD65_9FIRM|nr:dihydroxyacetone kinase phosphoryl donor subunit DhaM [Anaerosalibacter bizertensis]MBV1820352.1 PTS-dependent dihydroxyacetone kinase phosphotransferase subunit DhaM [Bacteroidales bacterium MSK.15.36]MCB5560484.1 PTS-dependent dihydroxyacetone kinase phosphotransferase subunit DhaM [Anaerosalibacter bizertensis]MCG4565325.1 PTS-dependent dihydroxyacetone kinase phosphotransferase subunit DhaM [Anaerosalibacter bizertensis]MCG4585275.1 PTS-dependent dihydroxyacetone kinase phosphotransferas
MIGIVIVSHSEKVSKGAVELCYEMADEDLKIVSAGGTEDGRIGTDAFLIKEGIEKVYTGDEVVIIADIGSSIMNAEMAIDMLDEEMKGKVLILDTPIVEGSIAVAVQASISNNIEDIIKAAEDAKQMKKVRNE